MVLEQSRARIDSRLGRELFQVGARVEKMIKWNRKARAICKCHYEVVGKVVVF